jgi:hypothetical protein
VVLSVHLSRMGSWAIDSQEVRKMKENKKMKMTMIGSYSDLIFIADRIDSEIDRYAEIKGEINVFPKRSYVINNRDDLIKTKSSIEMFSSRYASMSGFLTYTDDN